MKLIIFDLDGVLVDAKNIHFESLNDALPDGYKISEEEHLSTYDGLKTNQKLDMLHMNKGLNKNLFKDIWEKKQKYTKQKLELLNRNQTHIEMCEHLKNKGISLAVASNSIRETVETVLQKLGIIEYFDLIISNEDVKNSKPHPEMYWKVMSELSMLPEDTLIVEDSPYGLKAAERSNANVLRVLNSEELNLNLIESSLQSKKRKKIKHKWENKNMNVLIPMAGAGSRFEKAGYTFPKPLIEVNQKPMIQLVVENLNLEAHYIFVVQKKHREMYKLDSFLNIIAENCSVIEVDGLTEGAACTALLARGLIDNDEPLFFANSDQFVVF